MPVCTCTLQRAHSHMHITDVTTFRMAQRDTNRVKLITGPRLFPRRVLIKNSQAVRGTK